MKTMANDPVSRLKLVRDEIDKAFGDGFAQAHPELVAATMQSAASDYLALALVRGLQDIAAALLVEDEPPGPLTARLTLRCVGFVPQFHNFSHDRSDVRRAFVDGDVRCGEPSESLERHSLGFVFGGT
jgi:hypothetical protein